MNSVVLVLSVVVPLVPVVLFPTRFIGRSLLQTVVGAGLLVGMMMLLYFSVMAFGGDTGAGARASNLPSISDADLSALDNLLN